MANHSMMPSVKGLVKIFRSHAFWSCAPSQKQFGGRDQQRARDSFLEMMKSPPKRQDINKTPKEIANIVQTLAEFRLQIPGTSNLAVASIKNAEHLKYRRAQKNAEIIALRKKYTGDNRQNKDGRREHARTNRELHEQTCHSARNRPVQKSRNKTILWFTHWLGFS